MGKIYFDATSVENNRRISFDWMVLAAKQGNMEAQFRLGDLYSLGHGTPKCFSGAYQWYTKASIQGYKKALIRLHNLYQENVKTYCHGYINSTENCYDVQSQIQERKTISNFAIDYFSDQFKHYQTSDQEDSNVQLNLAFLYQYGYGVKNWIKWGFEYYAKAAEKGSTRMPSTILVIYIRSIPTLSLTVDKLSNGLLNLPKVEALLPKGL
jgi:TPR repeat protein